MEVQARSRTVLSSAELWICLDLFGSGILLGGSADSWHGLHGWALICDVEDVLLVI